MAWDKDDPFIKWGNFKNHRDGRVGLSALGDTNGFRTRVIRDDAEWRGVLRTKGGMPEIVYERKNATVLDPVDPTPSDGWHGAIRDLVFQPYAGSSPSGPTEAMPASTRWAQHRLKRGHTHYYNFRVPQDLTPIAASLNGIGSAVDTSILYGDLGWYSKLLPDYAAQFSWDYPGYLDPCSWIYRADAANIYVIYAIRSFDYSGGVGAALQRSPGTSWNHFISLRAKKVQADGSLGSEQVLIPTTSVPIANNTHLVLGSYRHTPYYDPSIGATLLASYYGAGNVGWWPPFNEINHSASGDQAYFHFLVQGIHPAVKWMTLHLIKFTLSHTGGVLSGSWAVDMDEEDCFKFIGVPGYDQTPVTAHSYARRETITGNIKTVWTEATPIPGIVVGDYDHTIVGLLMKGFDPTSGAAVKLEWSINNFRNAGANTAQTVETFSGSYSRASESSAWIGSEYWDVQGSSAAYEIYQDRIDILKNGTSLLDGGVHKYREMRGAWNYSWRRTSSYGPPIYITTYTFDISESYGGGASGDNRNVLLTIMPAYSVTWSNAWEPTASELGVPAPTYSGLGTSHPVGYSDASFQFEPIPAAYSGPLDTNSEIDKAYWAESSAVQIFTNNTVGVRYRYNKVESDGTSTWHRRTEYFALALGDYKKDTDWHLEATYSPYPENVETITPYRVSWNPRIPSLWLWEKVQALAWL